MEAIRGWRGDTQVKINLGRSREPSHRDWIHAATIAAASTEFKAGKVPIDPPDTWN
jgi:hypothetical protein